MRLVWRNQPRVTLKIAVYLTDVQSPDEGALEVVSAQAATSTRGRDPTEGQTR